MSLSNKSHQLSLRQLLIFCGLMVTFSMGIRHGFGLFNLPITIANDWERETFALTIALQNLVWGVVQPITGALANAPVIGCTTPQTKFCKAIVKANVSRSQSLAIVIGKLKSPKP